MDQRLEEQLIEETVMDSRTAERPDYGNWVSKRLIYIFCAVGLVCSGITFLSIYFGLALVSLIPAAIAALAFVVSAYFAYARYLFSPRGGNVQDHIWDLVPARLEWDGEGRVLDIGCGSAALCIRLAKKYPNALVVGVDYWGENWEYAMDVCEKNAAIEGVDDRMGFKKASASKLPFDDGSFDAVVSNLTFHEVKDAKDKREVVREALRVLKPGGKFTFQDLFLMKQVYGDPEELVKTIEGWGVKKVEFIDTHDEPFIPGALKLPFMVGTLGIITGEK